MKKFLLSITLVILTISVFCQNFDLELTFSSIDSASYIQSDSIKVMNRTQGGDTVLFWPDTVLVLDYGTGIEMSSSVSNEFQVFQNFPNPMIDRTTVSLYIPEKDLVTLCVYDELGRKVIQTQRILDMGNHSFQYNSGKGNLHVFAVQWRGKRACIKILRTGSQTNARSSLHYQGNDVTPTLLKNTEDIQSFPFSIGDTLLYIGYANGLQSGILDAPEESEINTFQFATNIPCVGTPIVEYEGQVYNTIQIFNQCWLKENLNVGTMLEGNELTSDNGIIEKYCYNNEPDSCAELGGFYPWDEMMQYSTQPGEQGICPPGWHIPTDEEWKVLEGAVDSQFGIGDQEWDLENTRGFDAGANLKSTSGWINIGNGLDLFGFSGLSTGNWWLGSPYFFGHGQYTDFWVSDENKNNTYMAWDHYLYAGSPKTTRTYYKKDNYGLSVRCIKD